MQTINQVVDWAMCRIIREPVLIIPVGPPGCGKSTLLQEIFNTGWMPWVASTDDQIDALAKTLGVTYSEAFQVFDWPVGNARFRQEISDAARDGKSIFIDRTNMTKKSRISLIDPFRKKKHYKIALDFKIDRDTLDKRLHKRFLQTGKFIPKNVVDAMLSRYEAPSIEEGFDEIIEINTNEEITV